MPARLIDCQPGDRVRIGSEVAIVDRATLQHWHMSRDGWRRQPHDELRLDLSVNPKLVEYPISTACEILCDVDRAAVLAIQQAFPGSEIIL